MIRGRLPASGTGSVVRGRPASLSGQRRCERERDVRGADRYAVVLIWVRAAASLPLLELLLLWVPRRAVVLEDAPVLSC